MLLALFVTGWPVATVRAAAYTVVNTSDSGPGSLRDAINQVNGGAASTVVFNIPGGGVQTIAPTGPLPFILLPAIFDATTQPGYFPGGTPVIQLNGASAGGTSSAFTLFRGGVTIKGFAINGWFSAAGTAINVASSNNTIQGNFIGTDPSGTAAVPNGAGIFVSALNNTSSASNNTIGGTTAATRNVISGNNGFAISFDGTNGGAVANNVIQGNYIGLNAAGTAQVKNPNIPGSNFGGIGINASINNLIGGTAPGARNVISGNVVNNISDQGTAIVIVGKNGPASGNIIQGNYIGTDATGTVGILNNAGVYIDTAKNNIVGGTTAAARNIIADTSSTGVTVDGSFADATGNSATGNVIQGNYIGTDVTGTVAIPNNVGVAITAANSNTIGGTAAGAGNLISANRNSGIVIESPRDTIPGPNNNGTAQANIIQGNLIGTTVAGNAPLGNANGIAINGGAGNTIGGAAAGARNIIFGFIGGGVLISSDPNTTGSNATGNIVQGNNIGTDINNNNGVPSTGKGVLLERASNNTIGGVNPGEGNTIANKEVGVQVDFGANDGILGNAIFNNSVLNIWLSNNGNNLRAAPSLTGAASSGPNQITVTGSVSGAAGQSFRVEFFSTPTATAQGKVFLKGTNVPGGPFSVVLSGVPAGQFITATATDGADNTSQFSNAVAVTAGPPASVTPNPGTTPQSVIAGNAFASLAVTVRDANGNSVGAGVTVTFSAPTSGPSGTFSNGGTTIQVQTDANGVASASFTSNRVGGTYQVTASVAHVGSATFVLTNAPNPQPPPRPGGGSGGTPNVEPPSRGGPSGGGQPAPAPKGR